MQNHGLGASLCSSIFPWLLRFQKEQGQHVLPAQQRNFKTNLKTKTYKNYIATK